MNFVIVTKVYKNIKTERIIWFFAIALLIIYLRFWFLSIVFPFQLAFRETTQLYRTLLLSLGTTNLYIPTSYPLSMSTYGFIYEYFTYIISLLINIKIDFTLLRSINFIFGALSSHLVFLTVHNITKSSLNGFIGVLLFFPALLNSSNLGAFPGNMGLFLFLLSIFYPFYKNYSSASIILSIITSILAFYTKAYFVLGIAFVLLYMFIYRSKIKALIYGSIAVTLFIVSLTIVNHHFPSFIDNTIIIPPNVSHYVLKHMVGQYNTFFKLYWSISLVLIIAVFKILFYQKSIKAKLIVKNLSLNDLCIICSSLILLYLGLNVGAYLSYYFQLLLPFLIIGVIERTNKYKKYSLIVIICFLINSFFVFNYNIGGVNLKLSKQEFNNIEQDLIMYQNIYNTPAIASVLLKNKLPIYDTGQTQYLEFSQNSRIVFDKYKQLIHQKIENQEFEVMYTTDWDGILFPQDYCDYYSKVDSFKLSMLKQKLYVYKYIPIAEKY